LEEAGDLQLEGTDDNSNEEMLDSNGNPMHSKETFEKSLNESGYVLIQLDDRHYQYEYVGESEKKEDDNVC
jgi:hypothetical protein